MELLGHNSRKISRAYPSLPTRSCISATVIIYSPCYSSVWTCCNCCISDMSALLGPCPSSLSLAATCLLPCLISKVGMTNNNCRFSIEKLKLKIFNVNVLMQQGDKYYNTVNSRVPRKLDGGVAIVVSWCYLVNGARRLMLNGSSNILFDIDCCYFVSIARRLTVQDSSNMLGILCNPNRY